MKVREEADNDGDEDCNDHAVLADTDNDIVSNDDDDNDQTIGESNCGDEWMGKANFRRQFNLNKCA